MKFKSLIKLYLSGPQDPDRLLCDTSYPLPVLNISYVVEFSILDRVLDFS